MAWMQLSWGSSHLCKLSGSLGSAGEHRDAVVDFHGKAERGHPGMRTRSGILEFQLITGTSFLPQSVGPSRSLGYI